MASPPTVDWKSLPDDLIRKISDCFVATDDLDFYMDFRAVCAEWRRVTEDPRADGKNPRFLPTSWIMLRQEGSTLPDASITFVNTTTGRFLRKSMTCLRRYFFVGASPNGLLVLGERAPPYQTRVLNPFTGAVVNFKAPIPADMVQDVIVMPSPMMVFIFTGSHKYAVSWADQSSESFKERELIMDYPSDDLCLWNMTHFADQIYLANMYGSIISTSTVREEATMTTAILGPTLEDCSSDMERKHGYYLVKSDGELLLVLNRRKSTGPVVYKVDTVNNVLIPVWSIGNRALFVSPYRSLSVDARKFTTVESGTIYFTGSFRACDYQNGGWKKKKVGYISLVSLEDRCRPPTVPQLFVDYCKDFDVSELEIMLRRNKHSYYSDGSEYDGIVE
ncbi:hypothetical protein QYE76_058964 [Lolium multiflorum]|uniref:KIB1-4 beta-propeller domain-containing protein n=1 Tax=Lolium multiflorum TaxID=4521 RepID=A0AAD8T7F5_LOLMU|nr:hypothetical protein QYE76_058964 [Lolium multiflorum]